MTVAPPGEFGKPRPAVILQREIIPQTEKVTLALLTSDLLRQPTTRVMVEPDERNGLHKASEVMADQIQTFSRAKVGGVIGSLDEGTMELVDAAVALFLGLG